MIIKEDLLKYFPINPYSVEEDFQIREEDHFFLFLPGEHFSIHNF
jgi:hypothetical protein